MDIFFVANNSDTFATPSASSLGLEAAQEEKSNPLTDFLSNTALVTEMPTPSVEIGLKVPLMAKRDLFLTLI